MTEPPLPLAGLRVIDVSTVFAGPSCARYLADFGADVIKVERPGSGDGARSMGWRDPRDGVTLWWKLEGRNKRCIVLDLKDAADADVFLRLCDTADVLVENFRPGTLERLGLGPDLLLERNPRLVVTRVTGFGQQGPYSSRPGFATIAEATGLAGGLRHDGGAPLGRRAGRRRELARVALPADGTADLGLPFDGVPPGPRRLRDPVLGSPGRLPVSGRDVGRHLDVSRDRGGASDGARRHRSRPAVHHVRRARRASRRTGPDRDAVDRGEAGGRGTAAFTAAEAAIAPVMTMEDIAADPHFEHRGAVAEIDGTPMQGLIARLSATPGRLRWAGRPLDADGAEIRAELAD